MPETYGIVVKSHLLGRLRLQDASGEIDLPGALSILLQDGVIAPNKTSRINRAAFMEIIRAGVPLRRSAALLDHLDYIGAAEFEVGAPRRRFRTVRPPHTGR